MTPPDSIPAIVYLRTGDQLPAAAFRTGTDAAGVTLYELALEDGGQLALDVATVERIWLEQLPAMSRVVV